MGYKTFGTITWILTVMCVCPSVSQESSSVEDIDCKPPWEQLHRTCVLFNKTKFVNWQEARNSCLDAGADLLTINDIQKDTKIKPLLSKHIKSRALLKWWIGIRQINNTWLWVDNDQLYGKLPEWDIQNRRSFKNQCGVIQNWGNLVPADCNTEKRPFICEQIKCKENIDEMTKEGTKTDDGAPPPVPTPAEQALLEVTGERSGMKGLNKIDTAATKRNTKKKTCNKLDKATLRNLELDNERLQGEKQLQAQKLKTLKSEQAAFDSLNLYLKLKMNSEFNFSFHSED